MKKKRKRKRVPQKTKKNNKKKRKPNTKKKDRKNSVRTRGTSGFVPLLKKKRKEKRQKRKRKRKWRTKKRKKRNCVLLWTEITRPSTVWQRGQRAPKGNNDGGRAAIETSTSTTTTTTSSSNQPSHCAAANGRPTTHSPCFSSVTNVSMSLYYRPLATPFRFLLISSFIDWKAKAKKKKEKLWSSLCVHPPGVHRGSADNRVNTWAMHRLFREPFFLSSSQFFLGVFF